jgi:hypothetical protein
MEVTARVIGRLNALSEIHNANFAKRLDIWKGCAEARLGLTKPPQRTHQLVVDQSEPLAEGVTSDDETYTLFQTTRRKSKPYITTFTVHGAKLPSSWKWA